MTRTTEEWEAELVRVTKETWCGSPEHQEAVAEVVRLRTDLYRLQQWLNQFPLIPVLVSMESTEHRAFEMKEKASFFISQTLKGETK